MAVASLRRLSLLLAWCALLDVMTPVGPAAADEGTPSAVAGSDAEARREFELARDAYDHGAFRQALAHFERAYELSQRRELLFNIARSADADTQPGRAIDAYTDYLAAFPAADNRDFVRARLEKMLALQKERAPAPRAEADAGPPGYREQMDEGLRAYDAGNFELARSAFVRAHRLFPNARTHRGIGKAEIELRNYAAGVVQLEAASSATALPLDDGLRAETEGLLARARSLVAYLVIETRPAASELLVDGAPVDIASGKPLVLDAGDHLVDAHAPGHAPAKRSVSLKGGERETLTIVFSPSEAAEASATSRRWVKSPWLWTAVGVVVAGAAVGTGVALARGSERGPYDRGTTGVLATGPGTE
jgi:hypothetical protein